LYYIETDYLGTPRQVVDRTRNVAIWKWDSLGNTFGTTAPNQDPDGDGTEFVFGLRFPGQVVDEETNLNYNYFRDYDPAVGRYVESDPAGLRAGTDTYSYVHALPLNLVDSQGLQADTFPLPDTPTPTPGPPSPFPLPPGHGTPIAKCPPAPPGYSKIDEKI